MTGSDPLKSNNSRKQSIYAVGTSNSTLRMSWALNAELEFYCVHAKDEVRIANTYQRAPGHSEEHHGSCNYRTTGPQAHANGNLQCLFIVHVDGI